MIKNIQNLILQLLLILIIFLATTFNVKSQTFNYQYFPKDEDMIGNNTITSLDSMFIWSAVKEYLSDSVFRFGSIECQGDTTNCCFITFKIDSKNNWYIMDQNKEHLFYDNKRQRIRDVISETCEYDYLSCGYAMQIKNDTLFGFIIKPMGYITGDTVVNWFNNKYGIVAVSMGHVYYVRNDFIDEIKNQK